MLCKVNIIEVFKIYTAHTHTQNHNHTDTYPTWLIHCVHLAYQRGESLAFNLNGNVQCLSYVSFESWINVNPNSVWQVCLNSINRGNKAANVDEAEVVWGKTNATCYLQRRWKLSEEFSAKSPRYFPNRCTISIRIFPTVTMVVYRLICKRSLVPCIDHACIIQIYKCTAQHWHTNCKCTRCMHIFVCSLLAELIL